MPSQKKIIEILKTCDDPEVPINIWDLGLVYGIDFKGEKVKVKMTLTSPHCPLGNDILKEVKGKLEKIVGKGKVEIELVWEPAWTPERISPKGKKKLKFEGETQ